LPRAQGAFTFINLNKVFDIKNYEPLVSGKVIIPNKNIDEVYDVYRINVLDTEDGQNFISLFEKINLKINLNVTVNLL